MSVIAIVFIMLKSSGSTLCVVQFVITGIVFLPLQNGYLLKHVFLSTCQIQSSEKKKNPKTFNNFFFLT